MTTTANKANKLDRFVRKHENVLRSLLLNAVILLFLLLLFDPFYDSNDDVAMCNMVDGSKGMYDYHLIFINCMIGTLLKWLYMTFSLVPWYSVLQYMVLYTSLSALTCVMWKRITAPFCRCAFLVLLISVSYQGYIMLQFSRTASIATIAGIVLLLSNFFAKKFSVKTLVCGYVLALLGSMYRFEQFLVVTALLSGMGVFYLLHLVREKDWKRKLIRCIGVFAVLFVLAVGFYSLDRMQYRSQEWQEYLEFNTLRAQLWDYGFPSYEKYQEEYEALDLDASTDSMFRRWNSLDPDRITTDTFRKLLELREPKKLDGEFWQRFICAYFFNVYQIPSFFLALFAIILWLHFNKRSKRETVTVIYELVLIGAVYLYLFYQGRYFLDRVDMGLWLAVAIVVFWMLNKQNDSYTLRAGMTSCLILLLAGLYVAHPHFRINSTVQYKEPVRVEDILETKWEKQAVFEEMGEDSEHLYLISVGSLNVDSAYGPFDRLPKNVIANVCPLGGWTSRSVTDNAILQEYGVENPFRSMINSRTLYLVDREIGATMNYIRKWYAPGARAELVKTMGKDCSVYRIVEERENKKSTDHKKTQPQNH